MAKLTGIIKLKGTLDDLTFYKTKDGNLVKTKSSITKERIASDPAFVRTRENGAEFGKAATAGKLFRAAVKSMLATTDSKLTSKVTKLMMELRQYDTTSVRGERNIYTAIGTVEAQDVLNGFNLNSKAILSTVLHRNFTVDMVLGKISFLDIIPATDIVFPKGATSVSLRGAWAKINFDTNMFDIGLSDPLVLIKTSGSFGPFNLPVLTTPTTKGISVFLLGVDFYQDVNGVSYSLNNGAFNALQVVGVAIAV